MRIFALLAPILISGCANAALEPTAAELARDGREIAQSECASCHAIGRSGESPNPAAPRFSRLLERYRADVLEQELIEGVQVAHPMPEFQLNPQGVDALIAYLPRSSGPMVNRRVSDQSTIATLMGCLI